MSKTSQHENTFSSTIDLDEMFEPKTERPPVPDCLIMDASGKVIGKIDGKTRERVLFV